MRSKKPLEIPEKGFKALFVPFLLTKNADQAPGDPKPPLSNNVILLRLIGRGDRI
jgi:hypothetical protein